MNPKIQRYRTQAAIRQTHRCYYCDRLMWDGDPATLAAFCTDNGLTRRQSRQRLRTAEHLVPKCEGGRDSRANIAAACKTCNTARHRPQRGLPPGAFRIKRLAWAARDGARRKSSG
jgi:5-methylcytosine-specific restriction endonuclease McrA